MYLYILVYTHVWLMEDKQLTYLITMSSNTHKKIIRFDISVNKVLIMYVFNTSNHLKLRDETCC